MENYVYNFFFEVREYYTFPSRVRAPDHEYGGPLRGDLPVRSCAAPNVPVENVWAKYTSITFIFQTWQDYIGKDSTQGALSKSQQHQHVKI